MADLIAAMFASPAAQPRDAYGWITNQLAHAMLGLLIAAVLAWVIGHRGWALAWLAVGYGIWEALQLALSGAGWADSAADAAFVLLGGGIGLAAWQRRGGAVAACAVVLVAMGLRGVQARAGRDDNL